MKKLLFLLPAAVLFASSEICARYQQKEEHKSFGEYKRMLESGRSSELKQRMANNAALYKQEEIQYLTALRYFYEGEYYKAVSALSGSYNGGALKGLKGEEYYFALIPAVYGITAGFELFSSEQARFRASGIDLILKEEAVGALAAGLASAKENLGYFAEGSVLLEVFPDKKSFALASTLGEKVLEHSGAVGICKFNRLMIISPKNLPFGYRWKDTIVHELVHLLVNRMSDSNCPLWLHEGIARYFDTLWRRGHEYLSPSQKKQLVSAVKSGKIIPFEKMHPSLVFLDSQEDMNLAFSQCASLVDFLIRGFGGEIIPRLLKDMKTKSFEAAIKGLSGLTFEEIIKQWSGFVSSWESGEYEGEAREIFVFSSEKDEIDLLVREDLRYNIRLGDKFYASNDYRNARHHYGEALKAEPKNAVALNKTAKTFLAESNFDDAEKALLLSLRSSPNYANTFVMLGDLYLETGKPEKALPYFEEALDINPFNYIVRKRMALLLYDSGRRTKAFDEFRKCLLLAPGDREIEQILAAE